MRRGGASYERRGASYENWEGLHMRRGGASYEKGRGFI